MQVEEPQTGKFRIDEWFPASFLYNLSFIDF
jgi:hypothetical protein